MSQQELLNFLISEIEKQGFDIFANDDFPIPAAVNVHKKIMIHNPDTITPFQIAHELSHIVNNDCYRKKECDTFNPQEIRANREAILLLWDIFEKNGGNYNYFSLFVELTGCPFDLAYSIISKEFSEMLEALNEIYEDELELSIDKNEMHQYATDYISYFDTFENINIYNFLDCYHLGYDLYDMAKQEFSKLLGVA